MVSNLAPTYRPLTMDTRFKAEPRPMKIKLIPTIGSNLQCNTVKMNRQTPTIGSNLQCNTVKMKNKHTPTIGSSLQCNTIKINRQTSPPTAVCKIMP